MPNSFFDILKHPNENGITLFLVAFLFTLSLYHFILFFQHKDRSYLYYSLYTFLIFSYLFHLSSHNFLHDLFKPIIPYLKCIHAEQQWAFNTIYLLFVKTFIDLKKERPAWNKFLNYSIFIYFGILLISFVTTRIVAETNYTLILYADFFLPTISIIAVLTMYVLFTMNSVLKYYILIGSFFYLTLSLTAFYLAYLGHQTIILFFIGIFIENIFFALGLGAKQRNIMLDKNSMQMEIILKQEQNIALQKQMKKKLDAEVAEKTNKIFRLTKKNQEERERNLVAEFAKKTLDLRMKALQTQMNPHFLFNSLNSIKHYIINNKKQDASYFLSKFSKLIRKILENSQKPIISLKEELEVMQVYLEIENTRLAEKIALQTNIESAIDLSRIMIPPLLLQPFIENAIWHGLAIKKGAKKIEIEIQTNKDYLIICIIDNGIGREKAAIKKAAKMIEKESLGIQLTKERLQAFTENLSLKASIYYEDLYDGKLASGTKVFINIPLR